MAGTVGRGRASLLAAALLLTTIVANRLDPAFASPRVTCTGAWQLQDLPSLGTSSQFAAVSGTASSDVWAVGSVWNGRINRALVEHWDGTAWSVLRAPTRGGNVSLLAVDARTEREAWAVGAYVSGSTYVTLIEHWNGRRWSQVPSPNVGTGVNSLRGVVALSATDAWAVGTSTEQEGTTDPLTLHWDGAHWRVVRSPSPGTNAQLKAVDGTGPTDVWAVGFYDYGSSLILHWDGRRWAQIPSPSPGTLNLLYGVAAASSFEVWAVGQYAGPEPNKTLVLYWDGRRWTQVPSPNVGSEASYLQAVWASDEAAWTVGAYDLLGKVLTLTEYWNGTAWAVMDSPNGSENTNALFGVWAASPDRVFAVGNILRPDLLNDPLAMMYC